MQQHCSKPSDETATLSGGPLVWRDPRLRNDPDAQSQLSVPALDGIPGHDCLCTTDVGRAGMSMSLCPTSIAYRLRYVATLGWGRLS
jgi:hypothetical protein